MIIFHLLLFYYTKLDTRQSCKLANTSAEAFDGLHYH